VKHTRKSWNIYTDIVEDVVEMGGTPCEQAPDAYFVEKEDHNGPEKIRIAKALCGDCPIKMKCLEYAVEAGEVHGIWGGLTTNERRKLTRNRITSERLY
jgi:WhiB family transcriptional regulator, redox-sensing transcriptional regulator